MKRRSDEIKKALDDGKSEEFVESLYGVPEMKRDELVG